MVCRRSLTSSSWFCHLHHQSQFPSKRFHIGCENGTTYGAPGLWYPLALASFRWVSERQRSVISVQSFRDWAEAVSQWPRRTRYDVLDILAKHVENCSAKFYSWSHSANLYRAALVLADQIVVTSDSMSMVSDAINSGKPVSIFRLPVSGLFHHGPLRADLLRGYRGKVCCKRHAI